MMNAVALALVFVSCGPHQPAFDATGIFEATEVTVSAEANGRLVALDVDEGSSVVAGQQVGLVDTVQLQLKAQQIGATRESIVRRQPHLDVQIAATRQQLAKAQHERARTAALLADGAATRKQMDDAENAVSVLSRQLEAQISTLETGRRSLESEANGAEMQRRQVTDQLRRCRISSPITGTVLEKYAEQGELATVGRPLFKVADTRKMFLRAYITSRQLAQVRLGQKVKVFADYGDGVRRSYAGRVVWVSHRAEFTPKTILTDDERANQVYAIKVFVHNDGLLKIGLYGELKL